MNKRFINGLIEWAYRIGIATTIGLYNGNSNNRY